MQDARAATSSVADTPLCLADGVLAFFSTFAHTAFYFVACIGLFGFALSGLNRECLPASVRHNFA